MNSKRLLLFLFSFPFLLMAQDKALKIGVAGLTHTHVHWILNSKGRTDIKIVGIAEANRDLAQRYANQHGFSMNLVYNSLEEMIEATQPEAVTAFGSIYEHLEVVEFCAPKGIHVMVEKPLAVNLKHAQKMAALAGKHNIHLLTNYETTWYPTVHKAQELLAKDEVGRAVKVIVRDGHRGPKKIGINKEFLDWLTDPVQNGGGAITDFGCYGVNLVTWLQKNQRPLSVTAVTQQLQAENNPKVDDEANILLTYEDMVASVQASWNWPMGRKDMEIYGLRGAIYADNRYDLRIRYAEGYDAFREKEIKLKERKTPYHDPFAFLAAVIRGEIQLEAHDLSALQNNLRVIEILDAARRSAEENRTIFLKNN